MGRGGIVRGCQEVGVSGISTMGRGRARPWRVVAFRAATPRRNPDRISRCAGRARRQKGAPPLARPPPGAQAAQRKVGESGSATARRNSHLAPPHTANPQTHTAGNMPGDRRTNTPRWAERMSGLAGRILLGELNYTGRTRKTQRGQEKTRRAYAPRRAP